MKRSKILIPTLSALAVTPAIALVGCGDKDSTEQAILDAIFSPLKLNPSAYPEATFKASFNAMSDSDKKKEVLYDIFAPVFIDIKFDSNKKTIADFYNDGEGGFKINITKFNIVKDGDNYKATFLGYISYIFAKQHEYDNEDTGKYVFKDNDYIMMTYDFSDVTIKPDETNCGFTYDTIYGNALGFSKFRFESGAKEALFTMESIETRTFENIPTNSKN